MKNSSLVVSLQRKLIDGTMVARACHDDRKEEESPCRHELGPAPDQKDFAMLQSLGAEWVEILSPFFGTFSGARLFIVADKPGLTLSPPQEWEGLAAEMGEWWRPAADDELSPELVEMLESALVFGRVEDAATYFALVRNGELNGHVVLFSHDGLDMGSIAPSFAEFLELLPAKAVDWIHADVRYYGDDSSDQYYPIAFRPGGVAQPSRSTLRIAIESEESSKTARYEFVDTTDDEVELIAPSGRKYSLVFELDDEGASLDLQSGDGETNFYVSGSGTMKVQARFTAGDIINGEIAKRPG